MSNCKKQSGVTLIELIVLMVVMAIIIPPLASGIGTSGDMVGIQRNIQLAVSESQACAEHILGTRRKNGFAAIVPVSLDSSICSVVTHTTEFLAVPLNRTVDIVDSSGDAACPGTCKTVDITIDKAGQSISSIQFMLIDY